MRFTFLVIAILLVSSLGFGQYFPHTSGGSIPDSLSLKRLTLSQTQTDSNESVQKLLQIVAIDTALPRFDNIYALDIYDRGIRSPLTINSIDPQRGVRFLIDSIMESNPMIGVETDMTTQGDTAASTGQFCYYMIGYGSYLQGTGQLMNGLDIYLGGAGHHNSTLSAGVLIDGDGEYFDAIRAIHGNIITPDTVVAGALRLSDTLQFTIPAQMSTSTYDYDSGINTGSAFVMYHLSSTGGLSNFSWTGFYSTSTNSYHISARNDTGDSQDFADVNVTLIILNR